MADKYSKRDAHARRMTVPIPAFVTDRFNAAIATIGVHPNVLAAQARTTSMVIVAQRRMVIWMMLGRSCFRGGDNGERKYRSFECPMLEVAISIGLTSHSTVGTASRQMLPYPGDIADNDAVRLVVETFEKALEGEEVKPVSSHKLMAAYKVLRGW